MSSEAKMSSSYSSVGSDFTFGLISSSKISARIYSLFLIVSDYASIAILVSGDCRTIFSFLESASLFCFTSYYIFSSIFFFNKRLSNCYYCYCSRLSGFVPVSFFEIIFAFGGVLSCSLAFFCTY